VPWLAEASRREEFVARLGAIPPEKPKFLDESGVTTSMTRQWGRAPKGERIAEAGIPSGRSWPMGWEATPQGRWQVLTTLGSMSLRGSEAAMTIEEATDGDIFLAYVEQVLCPKLQRGDVVVLDNLSAHKVPGIREKIEFRGAQLIDLPPYSPDLNPIEKAWSKFKQFLRSVKARTAEALDQAITEALQGITAQNAAD
jgi:transposase